MAGVRGGAAQIDGARGAFERGALVAGAAMLLASTVASALGGGLGKDQVGGTIQVFAMTVLGIGLFGLTRRLGDDRAAVALTVLAALGVAGGVGYGVDALHGAVHPSMPLDELDAGGIALRVPGILFPMSIVGIGVVVARRGLATRRAALAMVLGGLMFPVSRIGSVEGLAMVVDIVLLGAAAGVAWTDTALANASGERGAVTA